MYQENRVIPTTASFHDTWNQVGDQFGIPEDSLLSQQILWNDRIFHGTSSHPMPEEQKVRCLSTIHSTQDDDIHSKIEHILGFKIGNVYLYKEALIHKSAQRQHACSNERLEFLGDSVINLSVADYVFRMYPEEEEGFMTKLRTKLVNRYTLSFLANEIGLHNFIVTSRQINMKQDANDKIMEDAFEAFVGALYLDVGFLKASSFVIDLMKRSIDFQRIMVDSNYKDILLRHSQKEFNVLPEYELNKTTGPPHKRLFYVSVKIQEKIWGSGGGGTKKQAEQNAAKETLQMMSVNIQDFIK